MAIRLALLCVVIPESSPWAVWCRHANIVGRITEKSHWCSRTVVFVHAPAVVLVVAEGGPCAGCLTSSCGVIAEEAFCDCSIGLIGADKHTHTCTRITEVSVSGRHGAAGHTALRHWISKDGAQTSGELASMACIISIGAFSAARIG